MSTETKTAAEKIVAVTLNLMGNLLQTAAIESLISAFAQYRNLSVTAVQIPASSVVTVSNYVISASSVCFVLVDGDGKPMEQFPPIEVKKTGRFALPTIRSYREANVPNTHVYPGATSFDAALYSDMHVLKQNGAFRRAPQSVVAENVGGMAALVNKTVPPDAFSMVPANVGTVSAETGKDTAKLLAEIQGEAPKTKRK